MGSARDHDRVAAKPYLVVPDGAGGFRLSLRQTRFNSQNYPLVTETRIAEGFDSAAAARAFAKAEYGAAAGEVAIPPAAPRRPASRRGSKAA